MFVTNGVEVRKSLTHIGKDARAPKISPARGPPLWDAQHFADIVRSNFS
ncbi:MAG: hypothetical protein K2P84_01875 [Undibacterium sp.]|nr:hypothetical protein [Undibacterium sp.]